MIVGVPFSNRSMGSHAEDVGSFINTLPIRIRLTARSRFWEVLADVKKAVLEAAEHEGYPFQKIVEEYREKYGTANGDSPIYDTVFSWHGYNQRFDDNPVFDPEPYYFQQKQSPYMLMLTCNDFGRDYGLQWNHRNDLLPRGWVDQFAHSFAQVLEYSLSEPDAAVGELVQVNQVELEQQRSMFNAVGRHELYETVDGLFMDAAGRFGARRAVCCDGQWLTYGEVDVRSDALAKRLIEEGLERDGIVGVGLTRVVLLGILKVVCVSAAGPGLSEEAPGVHAGGLEGGPRGDEQAVWWAFR